MAKRKYAVNKRLDILIGIVKHGVDSVLVPVENEFA
jgi:hypothetical protein